MIQHKSGMHSPTRQRIARAVSTIVLAGSIAAVPMMNERVTGRSRAGTASAARFGFSLERLPEESGV